MQNMYISSNLFIAPTVSHLTCGHHWLLIAQIYCGIVFVQLIKLENGVGRTKLLNLYSIPK